MAKKENHIADGQGEGPSLEDSGELRKFQSWSGSGGRKPQICGDTEKKKKTTLALATDNMTY